MPSPYALFRLMWRPAALGMAFPLFWAVVWPFASLSEGTGISVSALWHDPASAPVRKALWHWVVLVPAALGLFTWLPTQEVRASGLGWSLPGLRRGFQRGTLLLCLPVATALGWALYRGSTAVEGAAAFAMACFWFLVPGTLMAPGSRRFLDAALLVSLVAAIALPERFGELVTAQPGVLALLALVAVMAMLRLQFSVATARQQWRPTDSGDLIWNSRLAAWWMGGKGEWTRSLADDRLLPWLHAGAYEAGYGRVRRYFRSAIFGAAIAAGFIHFIGGPWGAAWWFGFMIGSRPIRVNAGLFYPLSRRRQATAAYAGALIEGALLIGLASVGLLILRQIPFPESWSLETESSSISWLAAYVIALSFLPFALWRGISEPPGDSLQPQSHFRVSMPPIVLFMILVILGLAAMRRWGGSLEASELILIASPIALLTYGGLWWLTHRHFARSDLSAATG